MSWLRGRFNAQSIVHCSPELLLASEVALRRLDKDVAEQELDLIQFTAGEVAQTSAGTTQVVRGKVVDPRACRGGSDDIPEHLRRHAVAPDASGLVNSQKHRTGRDSGCRCPSVYGPLDPARNRN